MGRCDDQWQRIGGLCRHRWRAAAYLFPSLSGSMAEAESRHHLSCFALPWQVVEGVTSVKGLTPVLMAGVVDRKEGMAVKKDPIGNARAWFSADKRYLNLVLTIKVGRKENAPTQQKIGIVRDSVTTLADGTRCCWLTLAHDQNDVPDYYSQDACVSVPAAVLHEVGKVCLRVATTQGERLLEIQ